MTAPPVHQMEEPKVDSQVLDETDARFLPVWSQGLLVVEATKLETWHNWRLWVKPFYSRRLVLESALLVANTPL